METVTMQLIALLSVIIFTPIFIAMLMEKKTPEEIREKQMRINKRIEMVNEIVDDVRTLVLIVADIVLCMHSHMKNKRLRPTWSKGGLTQY